MEWSFINMWIILFVLSFVCEWIRSRKPQTDWITFDGGWVILYLMLSHMCIRNPNIRLHACKFELFHFRLWAIYFNISFDFKITISDTFHPIEIVNGLSYVVEEVGKWKLYSPEMWKCKKMQLKCCPQKNV